jgi:PAS domain S-box-containing protein
MLALLSQYSESLVFALSCAVVFGIQGLWLRRSRRAQLPWLTWCLAATLLLTTWHLAEQAGKREQRRIELVTGDFARLYGDEMQRRGHARLASDAATDDPLYLDLIETEKRWLALNRTVNDIYTLRKRADGKNIFLVDSETDYDHNGKIEGEREQRTPIGEVYEQSDAAMERAFRGEANFDFAPVTDRWGTWVSAFVPLRAPDGHVEGILGVDFDAGNFAHTIAAAKWRVIWLMAVVQMVLLGTSTLNSLLRTDAGERRRAYAALGESEMRFRQMAENIRQVFWIAEPDGRTMLYVSPAYEEVWARTCASLQAEPGQWFEAIVDEDRRRVLDAVGGIAEGRCFEIEFRIVRPDRSVRWIRQRGFPVRDKTGAICRICGTCEDVTEQRAADAELQKLSRAVQQSPVSIVITDAGGNIEYVNPKFVEITGYTTAEVRGKNPRILNSGRTPRQVYVEMWAALHAGREWRGEFLNKRKDGGLFWEFATISAIRDAKGVTTHFVAVKEDITARKKADEDLARVERELREVSRKAGMAEVATSVLHNVGNVLNSLNTSIHIAAGKVGQLKATSLSRIAAMLNEHAENLPAFLAEDPQGMRIPKFLTQLAEHFVTDQRTVLGELESLRGNLDHINEIVAMQQGYAGGGGIVETLPLASVIEDALRMNAASFERHGTQIACELDPALPPVSMDRNKLLMILVNLVRNAKHACNGNGVADKRITVQARLHDGGCAMISVSDNGVGIPRENLTRIFEYGFTTKKDGHGFGLHSSALAASEMGGSLRAQSSGHGLGATFTIELPLSRNGGNHEQQFQ